MVKGRYIVRVGDKEVTAENLITTTGMGLIAASLLWSGMADQATALGLTNEQWLYPLFGAVGSGSALATTASAVSSSGSSTLQVVSASGMKGGTYNPTYITVDYLMPHHLQQ